MVRITYSGLTQSEFRLDRVKSSCCDCPEKIPVAMYSNASCFTCFNSGISSTKVVDICPTLCLIYFIAQASASPCVQSIIYILSCDNFVQNVVLQMNRLSLSVVRYNSMHKHSIPFYNVYVLQFDIFGQRNQGQGH
jgi:hypothetical protein